MMENHARGGASCPLFAPSPPADRAVSGAGPGSSIAIDGGRANAAMRTVICLMIARRTDGRV